MNDFEQGLANIMGSFIETELDCVEKQNQEIEQLKQENKQLKEKINTYENPEDMTLMYMWCNEKAKDKIKQLLEVIEEVNNIIKMKKRTLGYDTNDSYLRSIEEILDKVKENK